jgi:hypothetical protein
MTERLLQFAHLDDAYKCPPAPGACNFLLELQRVIPFFQTSRLDQSHPTTLYLGDLLLICYHVSFKGFFVRSQMVSCRSGPCDYSRFLETHQAVLGPQVDTPGSVPELFKFNSGTCMASACLSNSICTLLLQPYSPEREDALWILYPARGCFLIAKWC